MYRILGLTLLYGVTGCASTTQQQSRGTARPIACKPPDHEILPVRVGIEFLPPAVDGHGLAPLPVVGVERLDTTPRVLVEAEPVVSVVPTASDVERRERRTTAAAMSWSFDPDELEAMENRYESLTLQFVNDVLGEDRRRMQRELGAPVLMSRFRYRASPTLWNHVDERESEEDEEYFNKVARRLIRKPLRKFFQNATELKSVIEDFKRDNIPLSDEYQGRRGRSGFGKLSMRLRLSRQEDPVELTYRNWGFRFGSNLSRFKATYSYDFSEDVRASVRLKYDYDDHHTGYRADLRWEYDPDTHLYMLLGDELDFMAGPTAYTFLSTPLDGTPGVLFYVEHLF